jgi:hypothetical protein
MKAPTEASASVQPRRPPALAVLFVLVVLVVVIS